MDVGEFPQMNIRQTLGAQRGESGGGKDGVETSFDVGRAFHARAGGEAECLGGEGIVEGAVVDQYDTDGTELPGEGVHAKSGLIPEATAGQEENFRSGVRCGCERWQTTDGGGHVSAAAGIEPLLPRTALAAQPREPRERPVVGEVDNSSGRESRLWHTVGEETGIRPRATAGRFRAGAG